MLELLAVFFCSYLIGSIPVGFLIVKKKADVDIRDAGSGKAGGFNVYVVTNSRAMAVLVGVLDALKGFVPVLAATLLFPGSLLQPGLSLLGAIAGHDYPVWTKFRGGRGLATAAGGMFLLGFSYAVVWCCVWIFTKLALKRDILVSNLTAIMVTPFILWILPWVWVKRLVSAQADNWTFIFFSCVLSMVLLLSHLDAVSDVWKGTPREQLDMTSPKQ